MKKENIIDIDTVRHIAGLAHLKLSNDEEREMKNKLGEILGYMDKLNELNTDEVQETYHTVDISNVKRADEDTGQSLTREEALANAPLHEKGLFKVPKIIKND